MPKAKPRSTGIAPSTRPSKKPAANASGSKSDRRYAPHPALKMLASFESKLLERTGKSSEEWIGIAAKRGPKEEKALAAWFATEHGFTTNYAAWMAGKTLGAPEFDDYDPESFVGNLFSGKNADLRPLYESIVDYALEFGDDSKACPCQTMVPLYRKHVYAEIRPTSGALAIDLVLEGYPPTRRLLAAQKSRAVGNRVTHQVRITNRHEFDAELKAWLRAAYEASNKKRTRTPTKANLELPADLSSALARSEAARATYDTCTPRMQADWIAWIEQAAKAETRTRRIATTIEKLAAGKKKAY
jgi:hypothetical protein